ncbi:carboxylating nicotinate-nucleotide diphosphorylase [Leucobacter chromiireducens]|uniref:nicotinate-nucleotide diphosphorylase (carboxylating) n=1 Tax=Leucobacter chromiireducens subsp. chromiireducens TaxID=660067 RepID=A0ABS1SQE7_9MICO|nr:carboxylating nicotinate-nucleotide diphosphorylase [Leucobacter chromiireducens]MBL3689734.1 carboxylating nicotinate-nucleotide diphosphorylase [Leucobacter chromiireducens subsp. chromiireducens]
MLTPQLTTDVVSRALAEDAPWGDLTVALTIPEDATIATRLVAREAGVFAGGALVEAAFRQTDSRVELSELAADGTSFEAGDVLARIAGPARAVLTAERIALNFSQRMSGIATLTARFVAAVAHTPVRIADTRKTTPGLRALEKHAVRMGGGSNHRFSLSDAIMVKDNHLAALGAVDAESTTAALAGLRERVGHTTAIIVEVDRVDQIEAVLAAHPTGLLLDNFTNDELRAGVELIAGRAIVEASGGVNLDTVAGIAETGVDVISVGQLTHGARALDLGLDAE